MNDDRTETRFSGGNPSGMIMSMKEEVDRRIGEIGKAAQEDMEKIRNAKDAELDLMRKEANDETAGEVEEEVSRILNRAAIEKKKLRLSVIDAFIGDMIREAATRARDKKDYTDFILRHIESAMNEIGGEGLTIRLGKIDENIIDAVKKRAESSGKGHVVRVEIDEKIVMGGVIVVDDSRKVSYNGTIDRIVYRRRDDIRRAVFNLLKESGAIREE